MKKITNKKNPLGDTKGDKELNMGWYIEWRDVLAHLYKY